MRTPSVGLEEKPMRTDTYGTQYRKYVNYIKKYRGKGNAATSSEVDSNANVENKNIATCSEELCKRDKIGCNRLLMIDKITEMYGKELAEEYIRQLESHELYKHDETSIYPYTYGAREVVNIKYNGHVYTVPFERVYELADGDEELLNAADGVWAKYPTEMYIEDKDGWTCVERVIRKVRHRDLVRVKTAFNNDIIVTDNHPLIISDSYEDTIPASESVGEKQYRCENHMSFAGQTTMSTEDIMQEAGIPYVELKDGFLIHSTENATWKTAPREIKLDRELGYLVGFFVGDGDFNTTNKFAHFTQAGQTTLLKLANTVMTHFGAASNLTYDKKYNKYSLIVGHPLVYVILHDVFNLGECSNSRSLPENIYEYNQDFAIGVIEGIIDSDGTVTSNGSYQIRMSSRSAVMQIGSVVNALGLHTGFTTQQTKFGQNEFITQKYQLFGVSFRDIGNRVFNHALKSSKNTGECGTLKSSRAEDWITISNIEHMNNIPFLSLNEYIYDITTSSHTFVCNNLWVHNCVSITMYPFLFNGLKGIGGLSSAPTNLDSFCGSFINLVFAIAAQFAGAVSTPEFLMYMDYFIRKDYGQDYWERWNNPVTVDGVQRSRNLSDVVHDKFQQIVYSINQPAAARGYQAVFWNIAYFDHPYFDGMFSEFVFPDGTSPNWDTLNKLQKDFMSWFNNERLKVILTFPVETMNLLNDGKTYVDKEWYDYTAQMYAEGHSFFTYTSDSVDSLASCCFDGNTKTLTRSSNGVQLLSFKDLYGSKYEDSKQNLRIFHNGNWVGGKVIRLPKADHQMYKITTSNNKEMIVTDNHIFPTDHGDKQVKDLTTDDYLLFNTRELASCHEHDAGMTYEQGYLIGMYLGDGSSYQQRESFTPMVVLYLNEDKYRKSADILNRGVSQIDEDSRVVLSSVVHNVYPVSIRNQKVFDFVKNFVSGDYCNEKRLNMNCLLQSLPFRRGILDGYYSTDGGNSNRIYTTSQGLVGDIETLITSLGLNSIVAVSDRIDEPVVIRDRVYKRRFPLWCIRWYDSANKRNMADLYKTKNNQTFFKISSIEQVETDDEWVYCFEMSNQEEPYFTLPGGVITHNCRLRNEMQDNSFSYTLGAGGVSTGSKGVMTININRLVQNAVRNKIGISDAVAEQIEKTHKYLLAYNAIVQDNYNAGLLSVYNSKYISLDKQYLTVGINGFVEGAEFLGIDISPNDDYFRYGEAILKPIFDSNKKAKTDKIMFNTEFVPAENLGVKNAKWDKEDGYFVPRDCYNSYFYKVEDDSCNLMDKFILHGRKLTKYLDGGSALHANLLEHLSFAQYKKVMEAAVLTGCSYYTFNIPNTVCNKCGFISKHKLLKCPQCGSEDIDYVTRVIGYLKRVSRFSEERQKEEHVRHYESKQD
jgi:anaerobic ribonucleoside-triphosphate reductase/intein/homing endonuclease